MKTQESMENYLETIYVLDQKTGFVRSVDVATELGFSKPTVSVALKKFRENGYVIVDENSHITLTEKGLEIAERIYERHNCIAKLLMGMGVDEKIAYEDACRLEHHLSDATFRCMQKYVEQHMN